MFYKECLFRRHVVAYVYSSASLSVFVRFFIATRLSFDRLVRALRLDDLRMAKQKAGISCGVW